MARGNFIVYQNHLKNNTMYLNNLIFNEIFNHDRHGMYMGQQKAVEGLDRKTIKIKIKKTPAPILHYVLLDVLFKCL